MKGFPEFRARSGGGEESSALLGLAKLRLSIKPGLVLPAAYNAATYDVPDVIMDILPSCWTCPSTVAQHLGCWDPSPSSAPPSA